MKKPQKLLFMLISLLQKYGNLKAFLWGIMLSANLIFLKSHLADRPFESILVGLEYLAIYLEILFLF